MYPTLTRLVQVIPRTSLKSTTHVPTTARVVHEKPATVFQLLTKRKQEGEGGWPTNLRLEMPVQKDALKHVHADARTQLKKLLREG